jgi:uncharacterized protein YdaU (DUF1376 family)
MSIPRGHDYHRSEGEMREDERPEPLVPPDLDLRDFPSMLLDVVRLRDSDLAIHADRGAFRAAVLLWCAAWHQLPAGSLPNDDDALMAYAAIRSRAEWRRIRDESLRGFVQCSDGRLYHKVVCEKALEALSTRAKHSQRTEKARAALEKKRGKTTKQTSVTERPTETVTVDCTEDLSTSKGREGKRREGKENQNPSSNSSSVAAREPSKMSEEDIAWQRLVNDLQDLWESIGNPHPMQPTLMVTHTWREKGYDRQMILEVAREKLKVDTRSLKWIEGALADRHAKRVAAVRSAGKLGGPEASREVWELAVKGHSETQGQMWVGHLGPPPGDAGCKAPREILTKYYPDRYPPLNG